MFRIILILVAIIAIVVGVLGFRGQTSTNRPWHVFLDMKYQARYGAQGQSPYFADGRASRTPVAGTIPYDGNATRYDAGNHDGPNPAFIPDADPIYFKGKTKPDEMVKVTVIVEKEVDGVDKDGKPIKMKVQVPEERDQLVSHFVEHIPKKAIDDAVFSDGKLAYAGWDALMRRGQQRYTINCAVCHGETGYGGQGDAAHGIVGRGILDPLTGKRRAGMIGIASYHVDRLREVPDGYLYDVIANGKNTMAAYGHQVSVADRWAIVAYIRAMQLSQNAPETLVDPVERPRLMGGAK